MHGGHTYTFGALVETKLSMLCLCARAVWCASEARVRLEEQTAAPMPGCRNQQTHRTKQGADSILLELLRSSSGPQVSPTGSIWARGCRARATLVRPELRPRGVASRSRGIDQTRASARRTGTWIRRFVKRVCRLVWMISPETTRNGSL